jgi:RNA polymerase sigma factor (sigma-70 family)
VTNEQLFNKAVKDNQASVYRICLAYLYDRSHAADLYQEIMLQVWKSMPRFRGDSSINTWIYRIAVNTAITYNAQYKKSRHAELPDMGGVADTGIQEKIQQEAELNRLTTAIGQLEEHDRLLVSLMLEGMSYKEIAEITGSNTNNIGVRINRIKTRLMKLMDNKTDEDGL